MKFIVEGWNKEGDDKEIVVEVSIDSENISLYFTEADCSLILEEVERLVQFVKMLQQ